MSQFLINPFPFGTPPPQGNFGAWQEIARATTVGLVDGFEVSGLPKKDYYWVLFHTFFDTPSGLTGMRLNGISATQYPSRAQEDGGAEINELANPFAKVSSNVVTGEDEFGSYFLDNTLEKAEHLIQGHCVGSGNATSPSASIPSRTEAVAKWTNLLGDFINRIRLDNVVGGNYGIGSELVVLGADRLDTPNKNANFWQYLGGVAAPGSVTSISLGPLATRKYLWLRIMENQFGPQPINMDMQVGTGSADSGTKYSERRSINEAADATASAATKVNTDLGNVQRVIVYNNFIVNPINREKMGIVPQARDSTNPGSVFKQAWKFNETTGQINFWRLFRRATSGGLNAGSRMDVWGHD